jgi:hypothetical protein
MGRNVADFGNVLVTAIQSASQWIDRWRTEQPTYIQSRLHTACRPREMILVWILGRMGTWDTTPWVPGCLGA